MNTFDVAPEEELCGELSVQHKWLSEKVKRLHNVIDSEERQELSKANQILEKKRYKAMIRYLAILDIQIELLQNKISGDKQ